MSKRLICLLALALFAVPVAAVHAEDRAHCEALDHEEHDLRAQRDHAHDQAERDRIDHRLHEIEDDRAHHCR
jgi:hypothetical protein